MLSRKITVNRKSEEFKESSFNTFNDCLTAKNVILLGEPGIGKTTLFKEGCEYEQGVYYTVKEFLAYPANDINGKVLYLDALDEYRSSSSVDVILEIVKKINELSPQ